MTSEKTAKEINDEIRIKRMKKGRMQCIFYGVSGIAMAIAGAALSGKILLIPIAFILDVWLVIGAPFARHLFIIGNIPYGIYTLWLACVDMPTVSRPGFPLVFMLILTLYITVSVVRIWGSEAVTAYLYEKNAL